MKRQVLTLTLVLAAGTIAWAQPAQDTAPPQQGPQGQAGPPPQGPGGRAGRMGPQGGPDMQGPAGRGGPGRGQQGPPAGMERALLPGPHGKWWDNPELAQKIGLNSDQQKKMDDIFQQYRLRLIDLNASVQREEITMEPLVAADQPDEAKIVAQIDKVAQARAELEKANARMLVAIRRVLTPEQFQKLKASGAPGAAPHPGAPGQPAPPPQKKR